MVQNADPSWRPAQIIENRVVARGSMWLTLEAEDNLPANYDPGHVIGLGVQQADNTYLRHAYTVSRGDPGRRRFEHLYRVIPGGRLTPRFAALHTGETVYFHGRFHIPIQQEVRADAESIVLIATGTGVGPLYGYTEKTLREGETRPITLYTGFHEEADFCLVDELRTLATIYHNFQWHFTVTHPSDSWTGLTGRVTESVPPRLESDATRRNHFHLVGNGEMVHLFRQALWKAGTPRERVTIETYFNHHAEPADSAIETLANRITQI